MRAVTYRKPLASADPDSLLDTEMPDPTPGPRDLLVEVRAVSVNPADVKIRASKGMDPKGKDRILGWDAAGVVRAVGSEVTRFKAGDEVFYAGAIDRQGTYAELHVVDERIVGRKPTTLDFAKSAAMPLTSLTAWELLFDRFGAPFGKFHHRGSLLIVGGAGGVGSMATQFARRLTSLTVIATASRPETVEWVKGMGAHAVVDHRRPLVEQVRPLAPNGVDYVMGLTHTDIHFAEEAELTAPEGHFGLIDDPEASPDVNLLKTKSASFHWEWMFTRARYGTVRMDRQGQILDEVADLVDAGVLRTTFKQDLGPINAANMRKAHALLESHSSIGKVVLSGF